MTAEVQINPPEAEDTRSDERDLDQSDPTESSIASIMTGITVTTDPVTQWTEIHGASDTSPDTDQQPHFITDLEDTVNAGLELSVKSRTFLILCDQKKRSGSLLHL